MHLENRILILSGLALIAMTMFFGVYYAVFDEHQTLVGMGVAMMNGFVAAADGGQGGGVTRHCSSTVKSPQSTSARFISMAILDS